MSEQQAPPRRSHASTFSKVMSMLVFPISAIPGYLYSRILIRRGAYKNTAKHGVFEKARAKESADVQAIWNDSNCLNTANEISVVQEEYRQAVKGIFEKKGMKNVRHYWKCLHSNQKWEAVLQGLVVTGIGIGALFSVFQNRELAHRLEQLETRWDEQSPHR